MSKTRPCLNCEDRFPGCHDICQKEDYLNERAWRERVKEGKLAESNRSKQSRHWELKCPTSHFRRERD